MTALYHDKLTRTGMSDDDLAHENEARDIVKGVSQIVRDQIKPLLQAAFLSNIEAENITRLAEALGAALWDFCPTDAVWVEKIQQARNS